LVSGYVKMTVPMDSAEDCEIAVKSLIVDEVGLPEGVSSRIECLDNVLQYQLDYDVEEAGLLRIAGTLDDFLANLKLILQLSHN
jgi:hypothetical protein